VAKRRPHRNLNCHDVGTVARANIPSRPVTTDSRSRITFRLWNNAAVSALSLRWTRSARGQPHKPSLALVFADGGYAGRLVTWARQIPRIVLEIVRKPEGQRGFAVLPRRWVVERTLSWLTAHRRLGPRLRTPTRARRGLGQVGHDRGDDPGDWPPNRAVNPGHDRFPDTYSTAHGGAS